MDSRGNSLNRHVKMHDSLLFIQETKPGRLDLYRKAQFSSHLPHYIFSLTDDWTVKGRPVPWGVEVVINRIKAHDLWRDESFADTIIKNHEKAIETRARDRKNSVESFLGDFRSQFAKATDSINTGNMDKKIKL